MTKLKQLVSNYSFLLTLYVIITLAASLSQFNRKGPGGSFTGYNNFLIFRESFHHLAAGQDLYAKHEPEHFDLYKYSPGFAVLMAPFSCLPDLPGLIVWNLFNALALFFAFRFLPQVNKRAKIFMLWFTLPELITNIQNSQSNGLIAGLLIFSFIFMENKTVWLATLFIILCAFIKIFGVIALILIVFYPDKIRFVAWSAVWASVFTFLPLLVTGWDNLLTQYTNWYHQVAMEHATSYGISLPGIIHSWFTADFNTGAVMIPGLLVLLTPLLFFRKYPGYLFRLTFLASLLTWLVIFNHRGESPTYIIAVAGVAVWYFSGTRNNVDLFLLVIVFILTSLSPTDLFPRVIRNAIVVPYSLKALPCVLIWLRINYDFIKNRNVIDPRIS
jgi:hypothetical protein